MTRIEKDLGQEGVDHLQFLLDTLAFDTLHFLESCHVLAVNLLLHLLLTADLGLLRLDQRLLSGLYVYVCVCVCVCVCMCV